MYHKLVAKFKQLQKLIDDPNYTGDDFVLWMRIGEVLDRRYGYWATRH